MGIFNDSTTVSNDQYLFLFLVILDLTTLEVAHTFTIIIQNAERW